MKQTISSGGQENISFSGIHQSHYILDTNSSSVTQEFCMEENVLLRVQESITLIVPCLLMFILV